MNWIENLLLPSILVCLLQNYFDSVDSNDACSYKLNSDARERYIYSIESA